jgi:predicted TIM-barrel fold metal-dependent hydrolase
MVRLLESGRVWVKISGAYRIDADPAADWICAMARDFTAANPERIVWGSDWPHTPAHDVPLPADDREQPFQRVDPKTLLELVPVWLPAPELRHRVLVANPAELYGFG